MATKEYMKRVWGVGSENKNISKKQFEKKLAMKNALLIMSLYLIALVTLSTINN